MPPLAVLLPKEGKGDGKQRSFQCMMGGLVVAGLDAGPNTVLP